MQRILLLATITLSWAACCWAAETKPSRILAVLPMPLYSHSQNFVPIFKELARRGHHITVLSPFPQKEPIPNWEDIVVDNFYDKMMARMKDVDLTKDWNWIMKAIGFLFFGTSSAKMQLELKPVIDLYNDHSRNFDLVLLESQFVQEPLLAFGHKYKAPVINFYPSYIVPEVAYYTGNPVFTSTYVPNINFAHSKHMTFMERAENTAFTILKVLSYNLIYLPKMDSIMREYFPGDDIPYIGDMLANVSFTLVDSTEVMTYPFPRANNMRGFLGVNSKASSPLPKDLQELMDGAEDGILFFTLGSHMKLSSLQPHIVASLLDAFSKIPMKILMKVDKEGPPANLPPNVITGTWFPQTAIMAHKNCRAFLTHTGVHGLVEAVHHAIPVISLPLFADQRFFAKWVVENEFGRSLDIGTITPEKAYEAISDVLINNYDKYKKSALATASLIKDVPIPTLNETVYWIEYVLRTKGARHLRPGSLDLPWYARFGFDLLAAALLVTLVPLWLLFKVLSWLVSLCRGTKTANESVKTKKDKKDN